ncbi:unnamed protein product [Rotaria sp. Silwood1]|nr:unnamed protein product [Rotaria sp. Silwood1]
MLLLKFNCHRWLDKKEGDGKIELDLTPSDIIKKSNLIPYEITVFTGDKAGAGTDAKVFIQIYGLYGRTEEIPLKSKSDSFERKSIDKFKIEAPDIGPIEKIRIGHHSENSRAAWYLEKVLIQRYLNTKSDRSKYLNQINTSDSNIEEYWFICRQWFDKDQGDKQTIRELLPTYDNSDISSNRKGKSNICLLKLNRQKENILLELIYLVHVFTGDKSGAGTDSKVFLTIYGQNKDSGERQLIKSKTNKNPFERKQEDIFEIKAPSLGKLTKIKIRHDNKGLNSAWYLDRIEIIDPETGLRYHFICQKWLAIDEDDKMISREIYASENTTQYLSPIQQTTTYRINVITADKFDSGTDAHVYIIIFGEYNDTVKSITNKDPFEKGHKDLFEIETIDIGQPKKIKIGHDNSGFASDWLLERVEINIPKLGHTWIFPCDKWISKTKKDAQLEIELYPIEMSTGIKTSYIPYEIKVYTSKISGAGTDANVYIQIYGLKKSTDQIMLCNITERQGKFQMGSIDTFLHELEDVGDYIEKIRIGHDNRGLGASWHLDRVEIRRLIKNQKTKTYIFRCNRWFAKDKDDGFIVRDLIPENLIDEKCTKKYLLDIPYEIKVYTSKISGSGTDTNVFLTMYGDKDDTNEQELKYSQTNKNKFERKQIDRFIIESHDLGNIYKIKVRQDKSGVLDSWFLEKIEIKNEQQTFVFNCDQWLIKDKGYSTLERILYEKNYQSSISGTGLVPHSTERHIPYNIKIKTGEAPDAGTSANVSIRLIGSQGRQTPMMDLEVMHRRRFEPGTIETFSLQELDIGDIEMIEIEHNGNTLADSWFLDNVIVEMPTKGRTFYFVCNDWLSKYKGDRKTKRILKVQDLNKTLYRSSIPYAITIYTGHMENAGCDCDISLRLFGTKCSSSEYLIRKQKGFFERSSIDVFHYELEDVGKLTKLCVSILPKSIQDRNRWYLEKIQLIKYPKQNLKEETYLFVLDNWIGYDTDYYSDIPVTNTNRISTSYRTTYRIITKTSDIDGANCDSNVFIIISGQNGDSQQLELKNSSTYKNKFERNHEDIFTFENMSNLGQLNKIRIWHDDSSILKNSWHLEYVQIDDIQTGQTYIFPCNKWLSSKKDDRQIVRELFCNNDSYPKNQYESLTSSQLIPYEILVITSDKPNAGTIQNGWIIVEGNKNRSEKLIMKNSVNKRIFQRGQTNMFMLNCQSLGELRRIILGHQEQNEYLPQTSDSDENMWHVSHIIITDLSTGIKYDFPVQQWININNNGDVFDCINRKEYSIEQEYHRHTVKYKIIVYTGSVSDAGIDINVSIILYGTLGNTSKILLKQKTKNLYERDGIDEFIIECLELGKLIKLHIENPNSIVLSGLLLDKIEVINMDTNEKVVFPCKQYLAREHHNHEVQQDLFPIYT